jgi:prolyl-tRNA editing enzyme YbaK/EbsC (Cys-tRNA(Pro) deacylase)
MSINELEKIKSEFERLGLHPTYLEHEAVITSQDAANTRGFELRQGIKSLLFTDGKNNWVIVDVPADRKADQKKIATQMTWSKNSTRMATPEEVFDITGCEIGSVPPFGHKRTIPLLVDTNVFNNTISTFNIGLRTNSVKIETKEMQTLFQALGATLRNFVKEDAK